MDKCGTFESDHTQNDIYTCYFVTPFVIVGLFWPDAAIKDVSEFISLILIGVMIGLAPEYASTVIFIYEKYVNDITAKLHTLGFKPARKTGRPSRYYMPRNRLERYRAVIKRSDGYLILEYPSKFDGEFDTFRRF